MDFKDPKRPKNSHQSLQEVTDNLDLVNEILHRLSFKSSIRCMAVCKDWYSLIKNIHSTRRSPKLSGLFYHLPFLPLGRYSYIPLLDGEQDSSFSVNPIESLGFEFSMILQSCNGMLLVFNSFPMHKYYVFNTVSRQHTVLPRFYGDNFVSSVSLAFDPNRSAEFKVVAFRRMLQGFSKIFIYSSAEGVWRTMNEAVEVDSSVKLLRDGVFWNNSVLWVNCNSNFSSLRFNVDSEELSTVVSPPIQHPDDEKDSVYLRESEGHLYFIQFGCYANANEFDVYELERDYSKWLFRYHVDLSSVCRAFHLELDCINYPWLLTLIHGDDDQNSFLVLSLPDQIVSYNLMDKTSRKLCDYSIDVKKLKYFGRWGQKCIHHHDMPVHFLNR